MTKTPEIPEPGDLIASISTHGFYRAVVLDVDHEHDMISLLWFYADNVIYDKFNFDLMNDYKIL